MTRRTLAALALLACSLSAGAVPPPKTHTVKMEGMVFVPATLTIKPGDSVQWQNIDLVEHTATASASGGFDSKMIAAGKSWKHTFKTKGSFAYVCKYHPTMKGSLVVK